ncbi:MAG: alpha/beta fold hydrolase [Rhodocyclaceae bacterium]|nr:alpha/beta fold hydrolase [Rhodocyclaceae bacterium]
MNRRADVGGRIELLTPGRKRLVHIASRLLPDWTARQAESLLLRPPRRRGHSAEVLDAWGRRQELDLAGNRLVSWQVGAQDAPAILLVHGWGGYGAQMAGFVPGLLAAGFRAVLFDHLGHGVSDRAAAALPTFIEGVAAVALACGGVVGAIAHSMGAAATLHAVREARLAVPRVVLIGAPGNFERHLRTVSRRVGLARCAHRSLKRRLEQRYVPVADLDRLEGLPVDDCAALLVHDRDDQEVDVIQLDLLAQAWPGARRLETQGWGHHRILRAPEVIDAAVAFVTERRA